MTIGKATGTTLTHMMQTIINNYPEFDMIRNDIRLE